MKNNTQISTLHDFSRKKTERYDIVRFSKVTTKSLASETGSQELNELGESKIAEEL